MAVTSAQLAALGVNPELAKVLAGAMGTTPAFIGQHLFYADSDAKVGDAAPAGAVDDDIVVDANGDRYVVASGKLAVRNQGITPAANVKAVAADADAAALATAVNAILAALKAAGLMVADS